MYVVQHDRPPPLALNNHHVPPPSYSTPTSTTSGKRMIPISSLQQSPKDPRPVLQNPTGMTSKSAVDQGRIYSLDVVQQPIRARMCGFGDKDRRPITPPPCIRLIVLDAATRKEIDINEIDISYYVLTVDLWNANGHTEVNLVRHSNTSPSISAATATSYPPPPSTPSTVAPSPSSFAQAPPTFGRPAPGPLSQPGKKYYERLDKWHYREIPPHLLGPPRPNPYGMPNQTLPSLPVICQDLGPGFYHSYDEPIGNYLPGIRASSDPRQNPNGMFTRNLIGSLCVSAFKLTDPDNVLGVWFVLQDLSVRTEGSFRLKMNFVNIASPTSPSTLHTGSAPVLATVFSDVFQVFSAKKFPGVIESTPLSKCFATQGIKIPIRKDGPRGNVGRDDEDDD